MKPIHDRVLSETIRAGILRGTLPCETPLRTWGGAGSGASCAVCGAPITPDEFEYELDYAHGPTGIRVHVHCGSVWEAERTDLERKSAARVTGLSAAAGHGNMRPGESDVEHRRDGA